MFKEKLYIMIKGSTKMTTENNTQAIDRKLDETDFYKYEQRDDGTHHIHFKGKINIEEEFESYHQLVGEIMQGKRGGGKLIALTFQPLNVDVPINSLGLSALIESHNYVKKSGGSLALCGIYQKLENVLRVTRVGNILNKYNSVDDAVNSNHDLLSKQH